VTTVERISISAKDAVTLWFLVSADAVVSEYLSPGGVILRAENSEYQPVLVPELTDFQFLDVGAVGVHWLHRVL
jgi:hypothetical protein